MVVCEECGEDVGNPIKHYDIEHRSDDEDDEGAI